MQKRTISIILAILLLLLQYPLWFGKGGWFHVWELERILADQQRVNRDLELRNQQLEGEVKSLQEGVEAVEERARYELGMTRAGEMYVQIVKSQPAAVNASALAHP